MNDAIVIIMNIWIAATCTIYILGIGIILLKDRKGSSNE